MFGEAAERDDAVREPRGDVRWVSAEPVGQIRIEPERRESVGERPSGDDESGDIVVWISRHEDSIGLTASTSAVWSLIDWLRFGTGKSDSFFKAST